MTKLGIIPAAGKAIRFGGIHKELLPISNNECLLERSIKLLQNIPVDEISLITNPVKNGPQQHKLGYIKDLYNSFQIDYSKGLWGAISQCFTPNCDQYYFTMPDTFIPDKLDIPDGDFVMGLFETDTPERFGVIAMDRIVDKSNIMFGKCKAWGFLSWSKRVARYWVKNIDIIENHTQAFNMAIEKFGYKTFDLEYYRDIASFDDYRELLCSNLI